MEGIGVAALGGIDIVQFALGIFFILKVIRQLVRVVWQFIFGSSLVRLIFLKIYRPLPM